MKRKLIVMALVLSSCGSMKLATNSGYTYAPKTKTETELKKEKNDKITFGIIILIALFIGDRTKVI
jgi:hypothetical protein